VDGRPGGGGGWKGNIEDYRVWFEA
jgi:hypothetical protein